MLRIITGENPKLKKVQELIRSNLYTLILSNKIPELYKIKDFTIDNSCLDKNFPFIMTIAETEEGDFIRMTLMTKSLILDQYNMELGDVFYSLKEMLKLNKEFYKERLANGKIDIEE